MRCTLSEIKNKEIIDTKTGSKLGFADDIEFETDKMTVKTVIIYGRSSLFGLFGKEDDIHINADDIKLIGTDTVLIEGEKYISPKIKEIKL